MINKCLISIIIVAALLLAVLGVANTSFSEISLDKVYASANSSNSTISLGDPFFVEEGKVIGQRVLSVAPQPS